MNMTRYMPNPDGPYSGNPPTFRIRSENRLEKQSLLKVKFPRSMGLLPNDDVGVDISLSEVPECLEAVMAADIPADDKRRFTNLCKAIADGCEEACSD